MSKTGQTQEPRETKTKSVPKQPKTPVQPNPVSRATWVGVSIVLFLLAWYITADRLAPWTDQARVQAWVIPIVPQVSGRVLEVLVEQDQQVKAGDLLARIDPESYQIAVTRAEAALELTGQEIGAGTASVNVAQAKVVEAQSKLNEHKVQLARIEAVEKKGAISKAQADHSRAQRDKAQAELDRATAELERAKQQLGVEGEENPKIRDALAALRQARIDLADTEIKAPSDGGITNLKIDEGYYASAGKPLMTFVAFKDIWIQANLRENSVANVRPGDPAEVVLDMLPARVFSGTVFSRGFAVKQPSSGSTGEAASVQGNSAWLRDAQRFPVVIHIDDPEAWDYLFAGGQADIIIYTQSSNALLNGLGRLWIRLLSWLSYVY